MQLEKSSFKEQMKDFSRDFLKPQFYICEIVDKKDNKPLGVLPFSTFGKIDSMVIINALAAQAGIESKDISFVCLENDNKLISAKGENDKCILNVSIEDLDKIVAFEKKRKEDEESGSVQESEE
jgi:hypothetical protein